MKGFTAFIRGVGLKNVKPCFYPWFFNLFFSLFIYLFLIFYWDASIPKAIGCFLIGNQAGVPATFLGIIPISLGIGSIIFWSMIYILIMIVLQKRPFWRGELINLPLQGTNTAEIDAQIIENLRPFPPNFLIFHQQQQQHQQHQHHQHHQQQQSSKFIGS